MIFLPLFRFLAVPLATQKYPDPRSSVPLFCTARNLHNKRLQRVVFLASSPYPPPTGILQKGIESTRLLLFQTLPASLLICFPQREREADRSDSTHHRCCEIVKCRPGTLREDGNGSFEHRATRTRDGVVAAPVLHVFGGTVPPAF